MQPWRTSRRPSSRLRNTPMAKRKKNNDPTVVIALLMLGGVLLTSYLSSKVGPVPR